MEQVKELVMKRALANLSTIGCRYAIIDPDGVKHGDLEIVGKKIRTRSAPIYGMGTLKKYYSPFIEQMTIGEVVSIPPGEFTTEKIRGAICSELFRLYGKGNYTTTVNRNKNVVEVLRTE
jgi:hypothetical protein